MHATVSVHYTALQMKKSMKSVSAINLVAMKNTDEIPTQPQGSRIALSQIDTLLALSAKSIGTQRSKSVHDVCIVHNAVDEKAHLGTK